MPFTQFKLHPSLLKGIKELGFARPTPIQADAIPPALAGQDVLACAMTGSGKTAAFILPILHRLIDRPRGTTRALVLTPTRELAAQILEDLNDLAVHTPITAASVFGGVGMGPQEHAFRSGADVIIATPGPPDGPLPVPLCQARRPRDPGARRGRPDARHGLPPGDPEDPAAPAASAKRQTLFFSATMPDPIRALTREMLRNPVSINLERRSAPAVGITHAVYPVPQELKTALFLTLLQRGEMREALVFTRTKHRADRLAKYLVQHGIEAERIHGNRSQPQRTQALAGFKDGKYRVLVATDIAARGIDIEALGHVVNFDVPKVPEDYIHRVGRTARAEAVGDAFTFVAPDEEGVLRGIERVIGKRLPRVIVPDFDYAARAGARLEIPIGDRIVAIRARKAEDRARAEAKTRRRLADESARSRGRRGR